MDAHTRFLLAFLLSLKKAARRTEIFAFNTALTRLTPWLSAGKVARTLERLAAGVPGLVGRDPDRRVPRGVRRALTSTGCVDAKTVVVIVSDGLDRGDTAVLARAMRDIRSRARRVIWLNPLLGRSALRADRARNGGRSCPSWTSSRPPTTWSRSSGSFRCWRPE